MKRTAFYISDGTGITAETIGHSLLSQFGSIEFNQTTIPYVQSDQLARDAVNRINTAARRRRQTGGVFHPGQRPATADSAHLRRAGS